MMNPRTHRIALLGVAIAAVASLSACVVPPRVGPRDPPGPRLAYVPAPPVAPRVVALPEHAPGRVIDAPGPRR